MLLFVLFCGVLEVVWIRFVRGVCGDSVGCMEHLLRASVKNACSELNPMKRMRVCIMCVQRKYALYIHS